MKRDGSTTVVYAALAGNLAIAVTNFGATLYTRSSAMFNEALHSTVDTVDQGLLYGMYWAERSPDEAHPFGYGLELCFWSFVVALMIFSCPLNSSLQADVLFRGDPAEAPCSRRCTSLPSCRHRSRLPNTNCLRLGQGRHAYDADN